MQKQLFLSARSSSCSGLPRERIARKTVAPVLRSKPPKPPSPDHSLLVPNRPETKRSDVGYKVSRSRTFRVSLCFATCCVKKKCVGLSLKSSPKSETLLRTPLRRRPSPKQKQTAPPRDTKGEVASLGKPPTTIDQPPSSSEGDILDRVPPNAVPSPILSGARRSLLMASHAHAGTACPIPIAGLASPGGMPTR